MPQIDLSILNQRQTPAFYADTLANRPAAGFIGRIFVSTNTFELYRDNGTGWDLIGGPGAGTVTGSGANGQVAFWNSASAITGNNDLFWDNVNGHLGIGTITPGTALSIDHDQNTLIQLQQSVATNDNRIAFINSGVGLWRIGAFYNAGSNDFNIFNVNTNSNALSFNRTSNAATFIGLITNNLTKSTIIADASCDVSNSFTPTTTITDINSYGLISRYKLNLTNGVYNSSGNTNATAIFGFVNIDGNNGTISTQSIRAITAAVSISTAAIKLADYRNYQVNTPEALVIGSTITDVYGLYINNQKGAANITITNGWGIYQNGASDRNYFAGNVGIGNNNPSRLLDVTDSSATTATLIPLSVTGGGRSILTGFISDGTNIINARIRTNASTPISIGTTGSNDALYIHNNGNIGIGTITDNGAKLQVNGSITINNTVTASVLNTVTNKVSIVIGGVQYYLLASTSAV